MTLRIAEWGMGAWLPFAARARKCAPLFSAPPKWGGGTPKGGGGGDNPTARSSAACPLHHASRGPPPPRCARGRIKEIRSRDASRARALLTTTTPRKIRPPPRGSGAPKGACQPLPHQARLRASRMRRARPSALTLAALATGYYPDGSAPEPGFPQTSRAGCFARLALLSAVKHAPCGPVFLPVDRGPRAARERMAHPPRGHRTSLRFSGLPFRKGALGERDVSGCNRNGDNCQARRTAVQV